MCVSDIDECTSNPCVNDATCVDDVNGYTCNCAAGYTGTHCEQGANLSKIQQTKLFAISALKLTLKIETHTMMYTTVFLFVRLV